MKLIAFISSCIVTWLRLLPADGVRAIAAENIVLRQQLITLEIYVVAKIQQASAEQLTQWVDDVLDAMTLDDLFKMFGKNEL